MDFSKEVVFAVRLTRLAFRALPSHLECGWDAEFSANPEFLRVMYRMMYRRMEMAQQKKGLTLP